MMQLEVVKQMLQLATSAFGLVAALAWNSAIIELFKRIFGQTSGLIGQFVYAVVVTVIAVLIIHRLSRLTQELDKKEKAEEAAREQSKK